MNNNMSTADLQNHNHMYDRNITNIANNYNQHHTMSSSSTMMSMKTEDDDMDFQDNKSETSSRSGSGKSKVFQCTGYGECSMVFTRSEHLARHMRKHTGEKPFKCVVPGCERMFSRFDNMMQHTQTHNKTRGGPRRTKPKAKRGGKKSSGSSRRATSSDDYDEYGPLPSPPPSRRGSSINMITKEQQIILPNPKYVEIDEDDDMLISDDEPQAPTQQQIINYNNFKAKNNFHENHGTFSNHYPDSPASSDSSYEYFSTHQPIRRRRSAPRVHYQPYPYNFSEKQPEVLPVLPRRNSALSQLANYLVNNPNESPESYLTKNRPVSSPKLTMTRRLSMQDLSNPIEHLDVSRNANSNSNEEGVDLTEDEYQAIQGFGQFYRSAITCNK